MRRETLSVTLEELPPGTVTERLKATRPPYIPFLQAGWEQDSRGGVEMRIEAYDLPITARYHGDGCDHENGYTLEIGDDYPSDLGDFKYLYEGVSAEDAIAYVEAIKQALE